MGFFRGDKMLKMLTRNKKWKDYLNYKDDEVVISLIFSTLLCLGLIFCNLYEEFYHFEEIIKDVLIGIGTSSIGIIGLALSGVAIITGLFSTDQIDKIEKYNGQGSFERLMSSFLFLAFNCALLFVFSIMGIFFLWSNLNVPDKIIFFGIIFLYTYFTLYNIFYAVSLVGNCIAIFKIRNTYNAIIEKDFFDVANEIRIDFIYGTLLKKYHISEKEFLNGLESAVQNSDVDCKERLIDYYYQYYTGKTKEKSDIK